MKTPEETQHFYVFSFSQDYLNLLILFAQLFYLLAYTGITLFQASHQICKMCLFRITHLFIYKLYKPLIGFLVSNICSMETKIYLKYCELLVSKLYSPFKIISLWCVSPLGEHYYQCCALFCIEKYVKCSNGEFTSLATAKVCSILK